MLELAAQRPVTDITVVDLCRAAGVVRDTFYRYATRPADVLAEALSLELAALPSVQDEAANVMAVPTRELLEHMRSRRAIYRNSMGRHFIVPVREALTRWIEAILQAYLNRHPEVAPNIPGTLGDLDARRMLVSYAASGAVGSLENWVMTDSDDLEQAASLIMTAAAPWWFPRPDPTRE